MFFAVVALLYIPFTLINLVGLVWEHMVFAAIVEVVLLCLVIRYSWKCPRIEIRKNMSKKPYENMHGFSPTDFFLLII